MKNFYSLITKLTSNHSFGTSKKFNVDQEAEMKVFLLQSKHQLPYCTFRIFKSESVRVT